MDRSIFVDGLGRRVRQASDDSTESLRLCPEVCGAAGSESALVDQAAALSRFRHPSFAPVLRVERLAGVAGGLSVVSASVPGVRLSELLSQPSPPAERREPVAVWPLVGQAVAAVAALHQFSREASHGAIGPERCVLRADGTLVLVEYVLARALGQLQLSRSQLWALFRVAVPAAAGAVRLDQQADMLQVGLLALSLLLERPLQQEDFPQRLPELLEEAMTRHAARAGRPSLRAVQSWMARALQLEARLAFRSALEADGSLVAALVEDGLVEAPTEQQVAPAQPPAAARPRSSQAALARPASGSSEAAARPPAAGVDHGSSALRVASSGPEPAQVPAAVVPEPTPASGSHRFAALPGRAPVGTGGWPPLVRALRISAVVSSLIVLWGASYLGARSYLGFPSLIRPSGELMVDSRPSGIELFIDGEPSGRTPALLQLKPGSYTLALQTPRGTTLVPVTVTNGARTVQQVDLEHARRKGRKSAPRPARR